MSEILEQMKTMSLHDLLALICEATLLLEDDDEWEMTPEQEGEMKRRMEEAKRDNYAGEDWVTVKAQVLAT